MPGLVVRDRAQIESAAELALVEDLGDRVREAAGTDVVDREDRIRVAERDAAVDHFLAAALDLGIAALDGGEVEILVALARRHRRGGAAAEPDQHRGPAEHDDLVAGLRRSLLDVHRADLADPAGQHDGLVVAAHLPAVRALDLLAEGAEIAGEIRAGRTRC